MPHNRPGHVYRLQFQPPAQLDLFARPEEQLKEVIRAGNNTTRYGRTWLIGQVDSADDILSGRIGFVGDDTTDIWDSATQDFLEVGVPSGTTSPFAIDLRTLQATMQSRTGQIRIQSLIGAFEALLADAGYKWKIRGLRREMSLSEWKQSVDRVTSIKFVIRKPNPHYHGAKNLEALMTELETEAIKLEAIAEVSGVNLESEFVIETEEHIERGYGEAEYKGIKGTGSDARESVYLSAVGSEEDSEEASVDPTSGEVPTATLRSMLGAAVVEEELALAELPEEGDNEQHELEGPSEAN